MHRVQNPNAKQSSLQPISSVADIDKNVEADKVTSQRATQPRNSKVRELSRDEAERNIRADPDPDDPVSP